MIKKYNPTTPGRRGMSVLCPEITKNKPEKSLLVKWKSTGGRNSRGRVTVRHRGGGVKRRIRLIDFKRDKIGIPASVLAIEYDPNRSANIALLKYADGEKRYIIACEGLSVGGEVISTNTQEKQRIGTAMQLKDIMVGTEINNVEMRPGKGAQIARGAGTYAQLVAKEGDYGHIKLPSGEVRKISLLCRAVIGKVGNSERENVSWGKAGRRRYLGKRPHTRGVAMNPHDHPLGGGEGKTSGGRNPCTPWGKPTKGYKTRKKNKESNKFIIKRRK